MPDAGNTLCISDTGHIFFQRPPGGCVKNFMKHRHREQLRQRRNYRLVRRALQEKTHLALEASPKITVFYCTCEALETVQYPAITHMRWLHGQNVHENMDNALSADLCVGGLRACRSWMRKVSQTSTREEGSGWRGRSFLGVRHPILTVHQR